MGQRCTVRIGRTGPSTLAGKDGQDADDEVLELVHEVAQELLRRLILDLILVVDEARGELDVGLGRAHLWELQKHRMLRRFCCATAVPILPGDAPITADGLCANEFFPYGRLAQSMAFFKLPGMSRLYSGVTNSTASTEAIASLSARASGG
jgi:hypothetical protein